MTDVRIEKTRAWRCIAHCCAVVLVLAGCATQEPSGPTQRPLTAAEGRALVGRLLPERLNDRNGWAVDLYAAVAALEIAPSFERAQELLLNAVGG